MEIENTANSSPPPTELESCDRTQRAESEHEEYGTVVTDVTVVTSTVTTRKKYRVEDA